MQMPRALSLIAGDILQAPLRTIPRQARFCVVEMGKLSRIENDEHFELVSTVRRSLNDWRSLAARRIKPELETILSHYRADNWQ